jgi:N-acetylglucosaminyl-diphospho-decaprenol L-rhamnosyltransferase
MKDTAGAPEHLERVADAPDLTVVIVTYNSALVVEQLLDSLPAALGGLRAEVVIIDNGSSDGTPDLLAKRTDSRVVRSTNLGYAAGVNGGVREATGRSPVLVLNPDVVLSPGCVEPLMSALRVPGTGVVAPQVRNSDGSLHHSLRREPSILRSIGLNFTGLPAFSEYLGRDDEYREPHVVDWALGAVLLLSRECFDALGGWDESYFLYSEETDFSLRARDIGYVTRYEPRAVVLHIGGGSGRNEFTHTMLIVNRVRLYRRRHRALASWVYYAVTILSEMSWAARGQKESRRSVKALLHPHSRPPELGAARIMPR